MTEVWEFYSPFAHIEGKYEWCRIRSTTHGVFDTFVLYPYSKQVIVYVIDDSGERFMHDRYPECDTYRALQLKIGEPESGPAVKGSLVADIGPVREATMQFTTLSSLPKAVEYGATDRPVWNSKRFACWGVDLVLEARASGQIRWNDNRLERLEDVQAIVTAGSFGRIVPIGAPSAAP
jgi:hypothetical protein